MQEEPAHDVAGTSQYIPSTQRKNEQMKENKERLCNGEIFFIKGVKRFVKNVLIWCFLVVSQCQKSF